MYITALGIIATAITVSSFLFNKMRTVRFVNFIGCLVWLIYGGIQSDMPIILVNSIIATIHIISFIKAESKNDRNTNIS
jgi:uncharacterized protein with PQ loop repeat